MPIKGRIMLFFSNFIKYLIFLPLCFECVGDATYIVYMEKARCIYYYYLFSYSFTIAIETLKNYLRHFSTGAGV